MAVNVTFEYDPAEHVRANREMLRRSSSRTITWGVGVVALGAAAWLVADRGSIAPADLFTTTMPFYVLGVFFLLAGSVVGQRRAARKAAEHDASAWGSQERIIDDKGFHSRTNGLSTDLRWGEMVRGKETDEFFLFYPEKNWAFYLPKRALSPAQMDEVRSLMRSKLSGRELLLAS